jgi:hypothetical protein
MTYKIRFDKILKIHTPFIPLSIMDIILGKFLFFIDSLHLFIIVYFIFPNLKFDVWFMNFPNCFIKSDKLTVLRFFF